MNGYNAPRHRYVMNAVEETSPNNGRSVRNIYRVDALTGKAWRLSSWPIPSRSRDQQGKEIIMWADAWEEVAESQDVAIRKVMADWEQAVDAARSATPSPAP